MKILSVNTTIPKDDALCIRVSKITKLMKKGGIDVDLVYYITKGFKSHKIFKSGSYKGQYLIHNPLILLFKHLNILRKGNYDLVIGNTFFSAFFCIFGKLMRKPLILDMHGISAESTFLGDSKILGFLIKIMESSALCFSDKIFCVSHEMVDYLHDKRRVSKNKLFYIPNGVDLDFFKQISEDEVNVLRKKFKLENKLIFGYLGGTHKWQGFENFIVASKGIKDDKFASIVVGCDISEYIQKGNITFIPRVSRKEIVKYYSLCDILVLPRPKHVVTEVAAPTKFAEYTSMGKPILTTNVGDAAKLVKKYRNGLVVKDNSINNLKKGINIFINMDKIQMAQMAQNSRKVAENEFDWSKIYINLINILKN